ncbi:selenium metabolism protein YedF [Desulfofundulus luciae]|uniref:Selenium metabolism protein YedF n=1 Tax=Desulfofundulus luciae TaxID=74702 RepID=A0ABU0B2K2_9FIRM|nr:sulfurtransferase-like selenium metabolism protein YedF [Desulfofundulus luciae]MDQ0286480.1 selenium metabolism protein YedF [Desulfofundulus luciae]
MVKKEVDCRGLACPQPVINTKKALEEIPAGEVIVTVDNPVARENVTMFAASAGYPVQVAEKEGNFVITITKGESPEKAPDKLMEPVAQSTGETRPLIYFFTSNLLGQGAPELGVTLLKSLCATLAETDPPPDKLIFLNTGVFLTCTSSPVLQHLKKMAEKGTDIISCGTCLEYYKLKDKLQVGRVSNMYEINEALRGPGKVITVP